MSRRIFPFTTSRSSIMDRPSWTTVVTQAPRQRPRTPPHARIFTGPNGHALTDAGHTVMRPGAAAALCLAVFASWAGTPTEGRECEAAVRRGGGRRQRLLRRRLVRLHKAPRQAAQRARGPWCVRQGTVLCVSAVSLTVVHVHLSTLPPPQLTGAPPTPGRTTGVSGRTCTVTTGTATCTKGM